MYSYGWCNGFLLVRAKAATEQPLKITMKAVLGLLGFMVVLMSSTAKAQDKPGGLYGNYTHFEACKDFLDGDQMIEDERWDIDFSRCLDRWPEWRVSDSQ